MASLASYGSCQTACNLGAVATLGSCMAVCAVKFGAEAIAESAASGGLMTPVLVVGCGIVAVKMWFQGKP